MLTVKKMLPVFEIAEKVQMSNLVAQSKLNKR